MNQMFYRAVSTAASVNPVGSVMPTCPFLTDVVRPISAQARKTMIAMNTLSVFILDPDSTSVRWVFMLYFGGGRDRLMNEAL